MSLPGTPTSLGGTVLLALLVVFAAYSICTTAWWIQSLARLRAEVPGLPSAERRSRTRGWVLEVSARYAAGVAGLLWPVALVEASLPAEFRPEWRVLGVLVALPVAVFVIELGAFSLVVRAFGPPSARVEDAPAEGADVARRGPDAL